jgi:hypothetical protein
MNNLINFSIMKKYAILIFIAISLTVLSGCKKDKGDPPVLPPSESMTIDFSNFENAKKGDVSISVPKGTLTSNWEFAAGVAMYWKYIIATTLAVPVYSFKLAANQNPVYLEDKTWQWSYNVSILNMTYKSRLTGQIMTDVVKWKMYVAVDGTGGFDEFVWFEGTSRLDGSSGQWILNESQQNKVPVLQIDWSVSGNKVGMIKYTYTKAGNAAAGSYIEYGLTSNTLNAYYTIHYYNSTFLQFYDLDVEWNNTSHNGRVQCQGHFGDTEWYCWDGNYINISCNP